MELAHFVNVATVCAAEAEGLYLATGNTFTALQYEFHIGRSTIADIVSETCQAIWLALKDTEMPEPTKEEWYQIADTFQEKTDFPNCLGAVDGKHIHCVKPRSSGSKFFNYKKYFSVVLMAVANANLRFISIDVGAYGEEGDSTVFRDSTFGTKLYSGQLNIPAPKCLPGTDSTPQPFCIPILEDPSGDLDPSLFFFVSVFVLLTTFVPNGRMYLNELNEVFCGHDSADSSTKSRNTLQIATRSGSVDNYLSPGVSLCMFPPLKPQNANRFPADKTRAEFCRRSQRPAGTKYVIEH
ncbi:unnamed protein product [Acanthoscelides obtectus]|uniref:DDE Tnp4 domain-containing protein n=1 Tax=Acanthoscelides obtectus TaxID=200917 RepID=A0A9P0K7X0_ACAOB|nr:unnamed protein product [Acanthoscelides obtectus]CAK1683188.1 hypothetical protein AOBTE_LOCUS34123 [Acanthoscelides obtectus]